jgi:uncharacterized protein with PQ loop repeat
MLPCDGPAVCKRGDDPSRTALEGTLRILAVVTMVMTIPQVIAVWSQPTAGGFALVSWLTYLVSSIAWLVYGIRRRDALLYLTNAGWIGLDVAIVAGLILRY